MDPFLLLRIYTIALCVWREARGESRVGKRLVAQVMENRVSDKRWPDTYVRVITQKSQFSSFNPNDPNTQKFPDEGDKSWADCVWASDQVLTSGIMFTTANHYHVIGLKPVWAKPEAIVATEGHHVFYTL